MLSFALMPKYLKEIFSHVPTVAFKLVSWSELWHETKDVFKSYNSQDIDPKVYEYLKKELGENITGPKASITPGHVCPQFALKLYFLQFKNPHGVFLDLRPTRFTSNKEDTDIFVPNFLMYRFSEDFRKSLISLYTGFYTEDEKLFKGSLDDLGLTKGLSESKREELAAMFNSHFGGANLHETNFNLKEFNDSFFKIFKFFVDNKVKLSSDFIYLGVYLITLYMHLDKTGPQDVKAIFLSVFLEE